MLAAFRNWGKTLLISTYILYQWYEDPDRLILVTSASQNHAIKIVSFVKKLIETCDVFEDMRPDSNELWGRLRLNIRTRRTPGTDPSLAAYGIGSQVTGSHVDCIILDDIEVPENSRTVEARDKLLERMEEFESIINPGGVITIIGTFQNIESIYIHLLRNIGYDGIRIPAEYPDPLEDPESVAGMWLLAPWLLDDLEREKAEPGDATCPERFPKSRLLEIKAKSPSSYQLQRLLDPTLSDETKYPLKLGDLIVHPVDVEMAPTRILWANQRLLDGVESPGIGKDRFWEHGWVSDQYAEYEQSVMWVDPAGRGRDEVGVAAVKLLNGLLYCPLMVGLDGGYDDATLRKIADYADQFQISRILVEPDFSDGMYTVSLSRTVNQTLGLDIAVEDAPRATSRGAKEQWICDVLEPVITNHRLVISPDVARTYDSMYQLTHITRERGSLRHDDRVEALAGAVSCFTANMFTDLDRLADEQRQAEMERELAEWDANFRRPVEKSVLFSNQSPRKRGKGWI